MEHTRTDILVAGGGVAGLTATAAFASAGFRVTCVDPAPPVTAPEAEGSDLRSTAFLMPSIHLLERAGLWASLAPHAAPLRIMRIADAGGPEPAIRGIADFSADEIGQEVFGYNLPNWLLRREMTARLEAMDNAELKTGAGVAHITPRMEEAIVRLSDGTQIRASLVIGADGRDSAVREDIGVHARRWSYGQKALVFTTAHTLPHEDISTEIHRTGGPFTLVPLPDHEGRPHSAIVWMDEGPNIARLAALDTPDFERELNIRACGTLGTLTLQSPRRTWPIISQIANRLDGPRTALVAEAAHVVPPIGAQGLNMSLTDITTLLDLCTAAKAQGADIADPALLARYHRARHPDILARVTAIDLLNRAAMQQSQPLRDLRHQALRTLHGLTPLRRKAMRAGLGMGNSPAP